MEEGIFTLDSISVRFITAREVSAPSHRFLDGRTILNLPDPSLEVVEGQVADLVLQAFEIHPAGNALG